MRTAPVLKTSRRRLVDAAERTLGGLFAGRILSFDSDAARAYANIVAERRAAGHPHLAIGLPDRGNSPLTGYVHSDAERAGFLRNGR